MSPTPKSRRLLAAAGLALGSLVLVSGSALAGSFAHGHGIRRAIALSIGVVLGAQLGARLSLRISGRAVEALLGIALIALAARLLVAAR